MNKDNALEVASLAGHIMLENGAEIARVEEVMQRIKNKKSEDTRNFIVISNGIFTTGRSYANVEYIPFHGTQLNKVVEVSQLSHRVEQGQCSLDECRQKLLSIRSMPNHTYIEQVGGSAFGSAAFCAIFGGGVIDCCISFVCGIVLWLFVLLMSSNFSSKFTANIVGSVIVTAICIFSHHLGIGNLGNIIIGAIIPLIPGVPFTNGIRDLAGEDYIAGTTRLLDALMVFICIALGVSMTFVLDSKIMGEMIHLDGMVIDTFTSGWLFQIIAAFIGTMAFAVLFGVPHRYYLDCGICGLSGWVIYLLLVRLCGMSSVESTFLSTMVVVFISYYFATLRKCPIIVFLVCGIFPLVPGAGVFWTSYNIVSNQLNAALSSGFLALKITFAIVFGIIVVTEIRRRIQYRQKKS